MLAAIPKVKSEVTSRDDAQLGILAIILICFRFQTNFCSWKINPDEKSFFSAPKPEKWRISNRVCARGVVPWRATPSPIPTSSDQTVIICKSDVNTYRGETATPAAIMPRSPTRTICSVDFFLAAFKRANRTRWIWERAHVEGLCALIIPPGHIRASDRHAVNLSHLSLLTSPAPLVNKQTQSPLSANNENSPHFVRPRMCAVPRFRKISTAE